MTLTDLSLNKLRQKEHCSSIAPCHRSGPLKQLLVKSWTFYFAFFFRQISLNLGLTCRASNSLSLFHLFLDAGAVQLIFNLTVPNDVGQSLYENVFNLLGSLVIPKLITRRKVIKWIKKLLIGPTGDGVGSLVNAVSFLSLIPVWIPLALTRTADPVVKCGRELFSSANNHFYLCRNAMAHYVFHRG